MTMTRALVLALLIGAVLLALAILVGTSPAEELGKAIDSGILG